MQWNIKCFRTRSCPKQDKKQQQKYWYEIFLLKRIVQFGTWKNCISKLSIKIFIKNKAVKAYAYRMFLSFKTSVTYNNVFRHVFFCCTYFDMYKLWKITFSVITFFVWMFVRYEFAISYIFYEIYNIPFFVLKRRVPKEQMVILPFAHYWLLLTKDRRLVFLFEPPSYSFYWEE